MPALRTELTEIVTGLGMLGIDSLNAALSTRPIEMVNVDIQNFDRLVQAWTDGQENRLFRAAWQNGQDFAASADGLGNRKPFRVEWKGSHNPPGYEQVPADLRVDYVYLISCKYRSKVLYNASPSHLFDRLLSRRRGTPVDWYLEVAAKEYQDLYKACRRYIGATSLPLSIAGLTKKDRLYLKKAFHRKWPPALHEPYRRFCVAVSQVSAQRWQKSLGASRSIGEEMLWRLLRLQSAPYFILGTEKTKQSMRYRVDTPWDFRQLYAFKSFNVGPDTEARQPMVRWWADLKNKLINSPIRVEGHVEVRWSHGRFRGAPEAKAWTPLIEKRRATPNLHDQQVGLCVLG